MVTILKDDLLGKPESTGPEMFEDGRAKTMRRLYPKDYNPIIS